MSFGNRFAGQCLSPGAPPLNSVGEIPPLSHHRQPNCYSPQVILGAFNCGLQLQVWPCQELINVAVAGLGGIPRELINYRNQLQIQSLISLELINHYSYRIGQ